MEEKVVLGVEESRSGDGKGGGLLLVEMVVLVVEMKKVVVHVVGGGSAAAADGDGCMNDEGGDGVSVGAAKLAAAHKATKLNFVQPELKSD